MPVTVTMPIADYYTLAGWVETYTNSVGLGMYKSAREMLEKIEISNDITRYTILVKWRDGSAVRVGHQADWQPETSIVLTRYADPWTYDDVMAAIYAQTTRPFSIYVTTDRTGSVGWTDIDTYFNR